MPDKLKDKDWNLLLDRIKDGKCTPFLGAGACCEKIPIGSQIASEWAKKYDYPMEDSYDLIRVAQFVGVTVDPMTPKGEICKKIKELLKEVPPKYFEIPDEPHGVLADLPLPVYITTNYDDFMVQALKSRGKTPIQEICRWNEKLKKRKRKSSHFNPTPEKPLVYHLHGCYEIPESLVLTEDDYLDFLAAISREQNLLPRRIQEAFTDTSLLFLGYRIADWDFHVLFRILDEYLEISGIKHLSVQLGPGDVPEAQQKKAQEYLGCYFGKLDIQVYWKDCREFAKELRNRWEAFDRGTIKTDTDSMNGIARNLEPGRTPPSLVNIDRSKMESELHGQNGEETNMVSILFLAADPTNESQLRLRKEFQEIKDELSSAKLRDHFRLELPQLSVRPENIAKALFDAHPQIVHFSGHGTSTGELCFEGDEGETLRIDSDTLAAFFEKFSGRGVNCIVLNACYSEIQAKAIAKHIKYVIGMNKEIDDNAAIAFSIGFYQALGGGCNIEDAYDFGCLQIRLQNIPGYITPVLITNRGTIKKDTEKMNGIARNLEVVKTIPSTANIDRSKTEYELDGQN